MLTCIRHVAFRAPSNQTFPPLLVGNLQHLLISDDTTSWTSDDTYPILIKLTSPPRLVGSRRLHNRPELMSRNRPMPPGFLDRIIYDLCDTLYANLNSTHASIKSPRINIPNVWRALVSSYHNNTRILEEHPQWYPFHTWCKLSRATRYGVCEMKLRWEVCGTVGDAIPPTNDRDPTAFFRGQMKYSDSIRREMNDMFN